jgi:nicotinate-nucleotide adenylyltransferase
VPLVLLIGSDQLERLDTWRAWDELLNHAHLAVARRNDAVLVLNDRLHAWFNTHWAPAAQLHAAAAGWVTEFAMTPVDASATEARRLLAQAPSAARDERLAAIVPSAVLDYIDRHRLYR